MGAKGSRKSDSTLTDLDVKRRKSRAKGRILRHVKQGELARRALGVLAPGTEIFGLTSGRFSLVNLIEEVASQIGRAECLIATWTIGSFEIERIKGMVERKFLEKPQFLMDDSFPNRQPEYCRDLLESFGEESVLSARSHAKFVVLRNKDWGIVIRTSMNMSENRLIEFWELSDDKRLASFLMDTFEKLYTDRLKGPDAAPEDLEGEDDLEFLTENLGEVDSELEVDPNDG